MNNLFGARFGVCLFAFLSGAALAQVVAIGRSSLTLPDRQRWTVTSLSVSDSSYTGDRFGGIPLDAKRLVLSSADGVTKAVVVTRLTKSGIGSGLMSWNNSCTGISPDPYVYKNDRSNSVDVDCLVVLAAGNSQAFLDAVPALKKDLDGIIPEGNGFY